MEKIIITENDIKISLFISDNKLFYIGHNNSNVNINKYLDLLRFDEDYFNNNGEYCIFYKDDSKKKTKTKKFRFKEVVLLASLSAILLLNSVLIIKDTPDIIRIPESYAYENVIDLTLENIKSMIYNSPYLSDEEKDYLYNEEFFTDILPFINRNSYTVHEYRTHLTNMDIIGYGPENGHYNKDEGYFTTDTPNIMYVKDYIVINKDKMNTVSHEYVHLCQDVSGYNLILEACAEIISYEYFDNAPAKTYTDQVILVKKLMEIIGPEAIWEYNFTGNFSLIEEAVKPYLMRDEYKKFLDCLIFDYDNPDEEKFKLLDRILGRLYENKYNAKIEDDEVIKHIHRLNTSLVRYYFNNRHTESYFFDYNDVVEQTISLQEAIDCGVVHIYYVKKIPTEYETIKDIELPENFSIEREIVSHHENVLPIGQPNGQGRRFIECFIDGVRYNNANIDELFERHLLDINYYLVERIPVSAEEYISGEIPEGYELDIKKTESAVINEDYTVTARMPNKIILPPVKNESYHL